MNDSLLLAINGLAGHVPLIDSLMVSVARDLIFVLFLIAAICCGVYAYQRDFKPLLYIAAALGVSFLVVLLMSVINPTERPFVGHTLTQLIPHEAGRSFPSYHASASAAVALSILVLSRYRRWGIFLLLLAVAIGFSRVYTGVHYPADILGGFAAAAVGVGIVFAVRYKLEKKPAPASGLHIPKK